MQEINQNYIKQSDEHFKRIASLKNLHQHYLNLNRTSLISQPCKDIIMFTSKVKLIILPY